ncbi:MAG: helix-turn-helix domain-containing protein [Deltaproteobacteria bacterium]|nr:helix-turn-helix domain-containing protein [Deltaproteobacteria bacterium]
MRLQPDRLTDTKSTTVNGFYQDPVLEIVYTRQQPMVFIKTLCLRLSIHDSSHVTSSMLKTIKSPSSNLAGSPFNGFPWQEVEKAYAIHVLEKNRWIVTRAANEAGVKRSTFVARMRRLGIRKS